MKRLLMILVSLLLLTGCGKEVISGEVTAVSPQGAYTELTIMGSDDAVLADAETHVYSFSDEIPHEKLLTGELRAPCIRASGLTRKNGTYLADMICVESYILPEPYVLADGRELNIRKDHRGTTYETADGISLLWEEEPIGPHNIIVGSLPSFDSLSITAQEQILAHYQQQGFLYDLDTELEKAYQDFLSMANPVNFQPYHLFQEIIPVAANETIVSYATIVTRPVDSTHVQETRCCAVFDRKTGEKMDIADLFQCADKDAGAVLLSAVQMDDPNLKQKMADAFRMEYVIFQSGALELHFPYGSLPGYEGIHIVGIDYKDLTGILQPWAIPDSTE